MRSKQLIGVLTTVVFFLFVSVSLGQSGGTNVYWHLDPHVKSCSMVIDPSLTQAQWHRFTKQAAAIVTFKSMASAHTLGKMKFNVAIDDGYSPVDQHDLAWINTFVHPDENCPLGDAVTFPTIRASMGVSDKMDIGGFGTVAPGANYGLVGGELKYAFLQESRGIPAAAVRGSVVFLTGVTDFDMSIYSVELIASKRIATLTPYVGVKQSLAVGTETTPKVDLNRESLSITQGYAGVVYSIWMLNLAAEYDVSTVNTFTFAIGFGL